MEIPKGANARIRMCYEVLQKVEEANRLRADPPSTFVVMVRDSTCVWAMSQMLRMAANKSYLANTIQEAQELVFNHAKVKVHNARRANALHGVPLSAVFWDADVRLGDYTKRKKEVRDAESV